MNTAIALFLTLFTIAQIDPHTIVGIDLVPVHSNCLLTYRADKSFACDRVFAWSN